MTRTRKLSPDEEREYWKEVGRADSANQEMERRQLAAIGRIGELKCVNALDALESMYRDPKGGVLRAPAVAAMVAIDPNEAQQDFFRGLRDPDAVVRSLALKGLTRGAFCDEDTVDRVSRLLADDSQEVLARGHSFLGTCPLEKTEEIVAGLLDSRVPCTVFGGLTVLRVRAEKGDIPEREGDFREQLLAILEEDQAETTCVTPDASAYNSIVRNCRAAGWALDGMIKARTKTDRKPPHIPEEDADRLEAVLADGRADWCTRLSAARVLISAGYRSRFLEALDQGDGREMVNLYPAYLLLGDPRSVPLLEELIASRGDQEMCMAFRQSGNAALKAVADAWAGKRNVSSRLAECWAPWGSGSLP